MTVKVKPYPKDPNRWWVELRFRWAEDKSLYRERTVAPVTSKSGAQRWGEDRERSLLRAGRKAHVDARNPPPPTKEVPTLKDFGPRFIEGHARAARQKSSGIATKESILKTHLYPQLGALRLDEVTDERVANLLATLTKRSRKTVTETATLARTTDLLRDRTGPDRRSDPARSARARASRRLARVAGVVVSAIDRNDVAARIVALSGMGAGALARLLGITVPTLDRLVTSGARESILPQLEKIEHAFAAHKRGEKVASGRWSTLALFDLLNEHADEVSGGGAATLLHPLAHGTVSADEKNSDRAGS